MISRRAARLSQHAARALRQTALTRALSCVRYTPMACQHPHELSSRRHYATPPPQLNTSSSLSDEKYHAFSDATMDQLLDSLETLIDDSGTPDYEVEYSSGVLTLKLGGKGTYVINKQPPNKQIWLSSPISGPKRYDYVEERDEWIYSRDQQSLGTLLNKELSEILDQEIDLGVGKVADCLD